MKFNALVVALPASVDSTYFYLRVKTSSRSPHNHNKNNKK
jgi:hypothetical protein